MNFRLFPEQASSMAGQVDWLIAFLSAVTLLILAAVFLPMAYFLYKYRRGNPADRTPPRITAWKLEAFWTAAPLVISFVIFGWGAKLYFEMETIPEDAMEINVIGKQWMWNLQHPEGKREINELHVPVGRSVRLVMTSQDVIHDFSIPAFRVKQDVVPGRYTAEWFKATKTGVYHLFCSEYCGTAHSQMVGWIVVQTPSDYERWLRENAPQASMAAEGERLYRSLGCSGCHGENSTIRAPSLTGIYGRPVPLETGEIVPADDRYLHDSILLPQKQIAAGYAPIMPSYEGQIGEAEVFQLIQYLKTLGSGTPDESLRQNRQAPPVAPAQP
jgi:cytochrome c oxidase subunit 2